MYRGNSLIKSSISHVNVDVLNVMKESFRNESSLTSSD